MKYYKVFSPAYRANGLDGTYISIAVCENDGTIKQLVGDHACIQGSYSNVNELVGKCFTDTDRFISIVEIECNIEMLNNYVAARAEQAIEEAEWEAKHKEFTGGNAYDFCYAKKAPKDNIVKYNKWKEENPYPTSKVSYYSFLDSIICIIESVNTNENTGIPKIIGKDGYFLNPSNGMRYYNLSHSYDAKLNLQTGEVVRIYEEEYNQSPLPSINSLLQDNLLVDKNWVK